MPFPFERAYKDVQADIETCCVDEVFAALKTGFLTMPKGSRLHRIRDIRARLLGVIRMTCNQTRNPLPDINRRRDELGARNTIGRKASV